MPIVYLGKFLRRLGPVFCMVRQQNYPVVIILFGRWIQHSVMARTAFKKLIGTYGSPFDRPLFGLASCLFLPAWTIFWKPITDCHRSDFSSKAAFENPLVLFGFAVVGVAFSFVVAYFFVLPSHVFGTDNYRILKEKPQLKIITGFPYGIVRHPAAAGFLWLFWALPSYSTNHIFYASLWTVFIVIGTLFEEAGLKTSDEFVSWNRLSFFAFFFYFMFSLIFAGSIVCKILPSGFCIRPSLRLLHRKTYSTRLVCSNVTAIASPLQQLMLDDPACHQKSLSDLSYP